MSGLKWIGSWRSENEGDGRRRHLGITRSLGTVPLGDRIVQNKGFVNEQTKEEVMRAKKKK